MEGVVKHDLRDREIREVKEFRRLSAEDLMEIIMREFRIGEDQIKSRKRGNLYRKFFVYMLCKHTGMKNITDESLFFRPDPILINR